MEKLKQEELLLCNGGSLVRTIFNLATKVLNFMKSFLKVVNR